MNGLAGKEKRTLRSRGQTLNACVSLGCEGIDEEVVALIERELERSELIKVRLYDETGRQRKETAGRLAEETGSEVVGITGRSVLLFRKAKGC
ncbi:MAG TPA: YhbY family RNA-binding protein [Phycisphaerae bacterium]|nr:YhbY family RNA-binding protein [Phycisphaerae bacterium]HPS53465.1 YhbY family RNA-binding protein [Phycisphaerae bacterium]